MAGFLGAGCAPVVGCIAARESFHRAVALDKYSDCKLLKAWGARLTPCMVFQISESASPSIWAPCKGSGIGGDDLAFTRASWLEWPAMGRTIACPCSTLGTQWRPE
jgi:hypothetical protein